MGMDILGNGSGETARNPDCVWKEFQRSLASLPIQARAAFLMRVVLEASDEEIATWIGVEPAMCRRLLAQARDFVRSNSSLTGNTGAPT